MVGRQDDYELLGVGRNGSGTLPAFNLLPKSSYQDDLLVLDHAHTA